MSFDSPKWQKSLAGDTTGVSDPKLGDLADNGGPTMTHALLTDSPAIDKGPPSTSCPPPDTDQRGVTRPHDGDADSTAVCDIGSFELQSLYAFSGFFSPVDNPPDNNQTKAGSAIAVKFSLGGDQGLDIFADGSPTSQRIDCDSTDPVDPVEETVTAGSSSLSYDATTDTYTYVWKTNKGWKGTCRELVVTLNDGSTHVANFKLVK